MLVLTREPDEEVYIYTPDGLVKVMIVAVRHNKARIGFTAPPQYAVHRREVAEAIERCGGDPSNPKMRQ